MERQFDAARHEMHLHTKLSDDVSVIGVSEIFEKAETLGLKTIAFTNLNNVQDFPEIMRCDKEHKSINVIYGAEVQYQKEPDQVYRLTLLAKNQAGIKELYKVISSLYELNGMQFIDLQVLHENRKNLLVGSCGMRGELYSQICAGNPHPTEIIGYDYFEIFPTDDQEISKKIVCLGEELGVPVIATCNSHYIEKQDKICCDIVRLAQDKELAHSKKEYIHTTEELLHAFSYLGEGRAYKVVLENPQYLASSIERIEPLKLGAYFPIFENAFCMLQEVCCSKAEEIYGNPLPELIRARLDAELEFLKNEQASARFWLAKSLVDFAKEHGQRVTTRGTVASTFIAFLLGVSEINPLQPHYYCDHCHYFEISTLAENGLDLPQKGCPICQKGLKADGHHILYEAFWGCDNNKCPEIDLNFPEGFRLNAQDFMEKKCGAQKVAQAGTVASVWKGIAVKYVETYEQLQNTRFTEEEKQNLINKIIGIKRGAGMHPGGLMLIPQSMEFEDFTPIHQNWAPRATTHFDFHHLINTLLKQNILGHNVLDLLMDLEKETGKTLEQVDFNDPKIYELFSSGKTEGLFEYSIDFVKDLLVTVAPKTFHELVKITALSHGTLVWMANAEDLIKDKVCTISEVIAARDDILIYLTSKGMDMSMAYHIMESVRKGCWVKQSLPDEEKRIYLEEMQRCNVPQWYVDSLSKIYYAFPKSHAVTYAINAVRLAWFKIYHPQAFYKAMTRFDNTYQPS